MFYKRVVVYGLLLVGFCLFYSHSVQAGGLSTVNVRLFDQMKNKSQVQVGASPSSVVRVQGAAKQGSLSQQTVFQCKAGQVIGGGFSAAKLILSGQSASQPLNISVLSGNAQDVRQVQNKGSRKYLGDVILTPVSTGAGCSLSMVNQVPLAGYLASVISSETGGGWPLEALKAQAVLTQTRLAILKPNETVSDTTQYELYLGEGRVRPESREAVQAVWQQILTYKNRPAEVYYHASCGGHTASGEWFNPANKAKLPYLVSKPCPYCKIGPFQKPTQKEIPASVVQAAFPKGMPQIKKMDEGGHPLWVEAGGAAPLSGYQFWLKMGQKLGWDKVPGSRFALKVASAQGNMTLTSVGAGHGVGLCQWGAAGMAKQGKSVGEILSFYFPGTHLQAW
jgi:stage II sporulation protein D